MKKFKDLGLADILFKVSEKRFEDKEHDSKLYDIEETTFWGFGRLRREEKEYILIHLTEPTAYGFNAIEVDPDASHYKNKYFTERKSAEKFIKVELIERINELESGMEKAKKEIEAIRIANHDLLNPTS